MYVLAITVLVLGYAVKSWLALSWLSNRLTRRDDS